MSEVKNLEAQLPVYPPYINAYAVEDEISLVDIWIALVKFKKVFFSSFILLLVCGFIIVAVFKTDKYNMTTTISIGQLNDRQVLQTPSAVLNKLNISILPALTRESADKFGLDLFVTQISNPKDTNLIVLENKVNTANQRAMAEFQNTIAEIVLAEHLDLSRLLNSDIQQALESSKLVLQKRKDPRELIKLTNSTILEKEGEEINLVKLTDKSYLESKDNVFQREFQLHDENIRAFEDKNRSLKMQLEVLESKVDAGMEKALVLEKISGNELRINEIKQMKLDLEQEYTEFKLETSLLAARQQTVVDSLESEVKLIESNWKVDIEELEGKVIELESQIEASNSKAINIAELSIKPVGLPKSLAYMIVVLLAIMAAFFITLLAIFRTKVIERMVEEA